MIGKLSATVLAGIAAAVIASGAAQGDVAISKKATVNMSCAAGVCSPTAAKAVLNATDLANMLASGDVTVTTGSGATNIVVKDSFSWTSTSRLTLDAIQSVEFDKPVTVAGTGAVTITPNDGGSGGDLLFGDKGNLTFWDTSSSLIIDGSSYTLVGDIKTLATDIAANSSGFYALANDYDASVDGAYAFSPITTELKGTVEGLGHAISNLSINGAGNLAMFAEASGILRDIRLLKTAISGTTGGATLLYDDEYATVIGCYATGSVVSMAPYAFAGGLVGFSAGGLDYPLSRSHTAVSVTVGSNGIAGGLIGYSQSPVKSSYALGPVKGADGATLGGLVGFMRFGAGISQSYAMGDVVGDDSSTVGGLVGFAGAEYNQIDNSYATGAVTGRSGSKVGGFGGETDDIEVKESYATGQVSGGGDTRGSLLGYASNDTFLYNYFDKDTSSRRGVGWCESYGCRTNVKGRTTEEFQAGLPEGFDPAVWGEKPTINNGFPYLLANPPPR